VKRAHAAWTTGGLGAPGTARTEHLSRLISARTASRFVNERNFDLLEKFEAFASQRGHPMTELAFGWLLSQPEVGSVIAGATEPEQVDENVAAGQWRRSPEELEIIARIA